MKPAHKRASRMAPKPASRVPNSRKHSEARKRAETTLQEKVEDLRRLAIVVSDSNDAVILHDFDGKILAWNRAANETYGYTEAEALGRNIREIVAEPDREATLALIQNIKQGEVVKRFELRRLTKDGRILDVWLTTTLVRDESGKPVAIATTERDITERKHAEARLAQERILLRTLIDSLPDRIYAKDVDGRKILSNAADWHASGANSMEDVIGKTDFDTYPPELASKYWAVDHEVMASGTSAINREEPGFDADRNPVVVLTSKVALHDAQGKVVGLVGSGRDITDRKRAEERIQRQLEHLSALSAIDRVISSSFDLRRSLAQILRHVSIELHVDAADILVLNSNSQMLEYIAEHGFRTKAIRTTRLRVGEGFAGRAALEHRLVQVPDLKADPRDSAFNANLAGEGFVCYYGLPLLAKGQVTGVLEVFHRTPLNPDPEWFDFLETLAGQAAIAVDNSTLFDGLQRSHAELAVAYDATIEGWSRALDLRDQETAGHTQRVTDLTVGLARDLGLSDADLVHVRRGALLHDIGKMAVPDSILLKAGPLTDAERVIMRKHPVFAQEMLSPIRYLGQALDIPYCHHEKWDGTGYPRGLKGESIPIAARIFAVIDVWDALTSDRPYRQAASKQDALDHIRAQSGMHFDPRVVQAFLSTGVGGAADDTDVSQVRLVRDDA